jgi:hypothetical protein
MSILGSTFGRALAGGGKAAAGIAAKYIDDEIARNRAQAIADIQFKNNQRTRDDNFAFENDPGNVATRVGTASTVAKATAKTQDEIELGRLTDESLLDAGRKKKAGDIEAETKAKTTAEIDAAYRIATDPLATEAQRISAERKLKELEGELGAREASALRVVRGTEQARAEFGGGAEMKLPPGVDAERKSLEALIEMRDKAIIAARADGMSWNPSKNPDQKALQDERNALVVRRDALLAPYLGGGGGVDPMGKRGGRPAAGGPAGPAGTPSGEQGARDVEAGKLMVRNEYGGDLNKARAALARLDEEASVAQGEAKQMMQSEADRLRLGIQALDKVAGKPPRPPEMMTVEEPSLLQRPLSDIPPLYGKAMDSWRRRMQRWRRRMQQDPNAAGY